MQIRLYCKLAHISSWTPSATILYCASLASISLIDIPLVATTSSTSHLYGELSFTECPRKMRMCGSPGELEASLQSLGRRVGARAVAAPPREFDGGVRSGPVVSRVLSAPAAHDACARLATLHWG